MLDVATVLPAPTEEVWRALVDLTVWPAWGPSIRRAELDGGGTVLGPGATGRVQTVAGLWLPFTVTAFEEGRRWAWKVGPVGATGHRVHDAGGGRTRAVFEVPLWAAPYAVVCRLALERLGAAAGAGDGRHQRGGGR